MEKVYAYYNETITTHTRVAESCQNKIHVYGTIRLLLVAGGIFTVWLLKGEDWKVMAAALLLFFIPFAFLMVYHTVLASKKTYAETFLKLCQHELKGLDYDFSAFDGAADKVNGEHSFSLDLDLFGERSFFQSINRTVTHLGRELLVGWLQSPLTEKSEILKRQEATHELSLLTKERQHFYVTGKLQKGEKNDINLLAKLSNFSNYFSDRLLWKILIWLIPALWIALFVGLFFDYISYKSFTSFFMISLLVANSKGKQINKEYASVNKMETILSAYSNLMQCIEQEQFNSTLLSDIHIQLTSQEKKASQTIKQLSRSIGALDQRFSLAGILLNVFILWDTRNILALEKWKSEHAEDIPRWFEALAQYDALCSLSGFAFNHPQSTYPTITDTYFSMSGKGLSHPLLNRKACVGNDISIEKSPWFLIITGANMAGKSTYLRTVGINYLLACIGAPVCAIELTVFPAKLATSLRTSDSLVSNESYFFAELKRLKMIIDRLQQGEKMFIILDEILKGTNSVDKQKGSFALMKQLVSYQACGIIATHDLALGALEAEFPDQIKNYRFEADITDNELTFSYKLREGVAQNMNACFLMKRMGITV